jgi:hypothetical protein
MSDIGLAHDNQPTDEEDVHHTSQERGPREDFSAFLGAANSSAEVVQERIRGLNDALALSMHLEESDDPLRPPYPASMTLEPQSSEQQGQKIAGHGIDDGHRLPSGPPGGNNPPNRTAVNYLLRLSVAALVTAIRIRHQELNLIMRCLEGDIRKRWLKDKRYNTEEKRRAFLREVQPDLPREPRHREGLDTLIYQEGTRRPQNKGYMGFTINEEDLAKRKETLMLLLNSRARNSPYVFRGTDTDGALYGLATGMLVRLGIYSTLTNGSTIAFDSDETYGQIYFEEEGDVCERYRLVAVLKHFGLDDGHSTLQLQCRLYNFLVAVVRALLSDKLGELEALYIPGTRIPEPPEPPSASANDAVPGRTSLPTRMFEAPYRAPAPLDLDYMISLFRAKLCEAECHLYDLVDDPAYFQSILAECMEHQPYHLFERPPKPEEMFIWKGKAAWKVIAQALDRDMMWVNLLHNLRELQKMQQKHAGVDFAGHPIPKELLDAYCALHVRLRRQYRRHITNLSFYASHSPKWRPYFRSFSSTAHWSVKKDSEIDIVLKRKTDVELPAPIQHLDGLMVRYVNESNVGLDAAGPEIRERVRRSWAMVQAGNEDVLMQALNREFEEVYTAEPGLFSSSLARELSMLSVIAVCLNQLERWPFCKAYAVQEVGRWTEEEVQRFNAKLRKENPLSPNGKIVATFQVPKDTTRLAWPDDDRFLYPVDKPRTPENIAKLRQAVKALDDFWTSMFAQFPVVPPRLPSTRRKELLMKAADHPCPPWVEKLPWEQHFKAKPVAEPTDLSSANWKVIHRIFYVPSQHETPPTKPLL